MSVSNGRRLSAEDHDQLKALLQSGTSVAAAAFLIGCSEATAWYWAQKLGLPASAGEQVRLHTRAICIRAECDRRVKKGERLCEQHRTVPLPVGGSDFIRPLTAAELMRGR